MGRKARCKAGAADGGRSSMRFALRLKQTLLQGAFPRGVGGSAISKAAALRLPKGGRFQLVMIEIGYADPPPEHGRGRPPVNRCWPLRHRFCPGFLASFWASAGSGVM